MTIPTFSRVEIRTDTADDLIAAERALHSLANQLRRIAASVENERLMRLAAHDAIRATSTQLRGGK